MDFNILLAQVNPCVGDIIGNEAMVMKAWEGVSDGLLVMPELCLSGYPPEDLLLRSDFLDALDASLQRLVERSKSTPAGLLLSTASRINDKLYNAVHLIEDGEIKATTTKHILPNYGVFDEKRLFESGGLPVPIDWRGGRLGVMICEDMWDSTTSAHLKKCGAEQLIVINASPYEQNKHKQRLDEARERVRETGLALLYVNQVGGQDSLIFDGGSFSLESDGGISMQSPFFKEGVFSKGDVCNSKRPNLYDGLVMATKDYARKNGFKKALLGLSGGIDSTLVAAIAADALGGENVSAIAMPTRFTSTQSLDDARELSKNLGINYKVISIEKPLLEMEELIGVKSGLAHENLQARLRGDILMTHANDSGAIVLATGNKSELSVGYCTLYGDMCGGLAPIGDVYKTLVFELCAKDSRIPRQIITRPPTAELKHDQADTDSLPTYDVLDDILHKLIELDLPPKSALEEKILKMLMRAEHKRRQAPPAPKVTSRAIIRDRRWPITNGMT